MPRRCSGDGAHRDLGDPADLQHQRRLRHCQVDWQRLTGSQGTTSARNRASIPRMQARSRDPCLGLSQPVKPSLESARWDSADPIGPRQRRDRRPRGFDSSLHPFHHSISRDSSLKAHLPKQQKTLGSTLRPLVRVCRLCAQTQASRVDGSPSCRLPRQSVRRKGVNVA